MNVYLDESGDLGWSFDKPYRHGGSSRYLTIASLIIPKTLIHKTKRIVRKVYAARNESTSEELKGKDLNKNEKMRFIKSVISLLSSESSISIAAITVSKKNVQPHIRADANKLYNYMVYFSILDKISKQPSVDFIPDPRTIKVSSGNSLVDYLQIKLWFELNSATVIRHVPQESKASLNLQFADFISHIIWSRYEDSEIDVYNLIKPHIYEKHLFF
jgi:hypothetical protein